MLAQEGCPRKFYRSNIGYIIRNPVYSGWIEWPKNTERILGHHEPIITREMQAAAIRGLERFERPKYNQHNYTYQGLIKCGECGCSVVRELKKGRFMYWHCTWRRPCRNTTYLRQEAVDQQFYDRFLSLRVNDQSVDEFLRSLETDASNLLVRQEGQLAIHQQDLHKIQNYMNRALEMKFDGKISEIEWEESRREWKSKAITLEQEINNLEEAAPCLSMREIKTTLELGKELIPKWNSLDGKNKRLLIQSTCSNCTMLGENISIAIKTPYNLLENMRV